MATTIFETWVEVGRISVGAEVCEHGVKLHWETPDGKDGGFAMISDYQARRLYESLKKVMEK